MDLYARVNILGGRAVRLPKGDVENAISLDANPIERAVGWVNKGIDKLHIVDLDAAAYGDYRNRSLIHDLIAAVDAPVQVAGGVRSALEVKRLLDAGAWRVVMGTVAIEDQVLLWDICRANPDRVVVSVDVRTDYELATRGWTQNSGRFLEEVLIELSSAGVAGYMVQEVGRDALSEPPNYDALRSALAIVAEPVVAAGGVRNLDDLQQLLELQESGRRLGGVVVGREVTEGRFAMEEATALIHGSDPETSVDLGWCDVCFGVADAARSQSFYERLGFRRVAGDAGSGWLVMTNDEVRLGFFEDGVDAPTLNFRGRDVRTLVSELEQLGLAMDTPPHEESDGSVGALFHDPDGVAIYLNTSPGETKPT